MSTRGRLVMAASCVVLMAGSAWAQPLGTFRWQQQPYCNIFALNVIGEGGNYTLDGTDDLCGATQKASVSGLAFLNPDGTVGFDLTIVTRPDANPLHITATINLVTLGGTWRDTNGNNGTLAFTPGVGSGGSPRPVTPASPSRVSFTYDLAAGAISPPIRIPDNIPVQLKGVTLTFNFRGVGQAELLSIPGDGGFIEWVGLDSTAGAAITQGFSGVTGTKILFIDYAHQVIVEVAGPAGSGQIRVRNTAAAPRNGIITLVY